MAVKLTPNELVLLTAFRAAGDAWQTPGMLIAAQPEALAGRTAEGLHRTASGLERSGLLARMFSGRVHYKITDLGLSTLEEAR